MQKTPVFSWVIYYNKESPIVPAGPLPSCPVLSDQQSLRRAVPISRPVQNQEVPHCSFGRDLHKPVHSPRKHRLFAPSWGVKRKSKLHLAPWREPPPRGSAGWLRGAPRGFDLLRRGNKLAGPPALRPQSRSRGGQALGPALPGVPADQGGATSPQEQRGIEGRRTGNRARGGKAASAGQGGEPERALPRGVRQQTDLGGVLALPFRGWTS